MPGVLLGAGFDLPGCSSIAVPTQTWKVVVTKLGGSDIVGEVDRRRVATGRRGERLERLRVGAIPDAHTDERQLVRDLRAQLREVLRTGRDHAIAEVDEESLEGGRLEAACEWARSHGVASYVPVSPDLPNTAGVEAWLREHGFSPAYAWMKFVRDPHPPRFPAPANLEVVELSEADEEPFGMIAAVGFGMPVASQSSRSDSGPASRASTMAIALSRTPIPLTLWSTKRDYCLKE